EGRGARRRRRRRAHARRRPPRPDVVLGADRARRVRDARDVGDRRGDRRRGERGRAGRSGAGPAMRPRMVAALAIVSAAGAARAGDDILTPCGTRLPHAVAYAARGRLVVRATDVPGPCGDGPWKAPPPWDAVVTIDLAPGPGGRFFAGAPFGAIAGYAKRSLMEASGLD